ncbi:YceI family protein [Ornithobacterium rhinotracheale]|uniref:YceI family protein n=1 Tax=Ornithobacterium rhinotracheale TaxID=28251 RepID=A0A410JRD6_ORNRH|nr:YceI family protein [Ornithobacterium rhinotracheale]QAR30709.1 YceI family protein [Ornithobacterium rhinotracheale]
MKKILTLSLASLLAFSCSKKQEAVPISPEAPEITADPSDSVSEGEYTYHPETTKLTWTAYKTPEKVGVEGTFTEYELMGYKTAAIKEDVLSGAKFKINSQSVETGDQSRDNLLRTLFFGAMTSPEIQGSFGQFSDGVVPVTLKLNDHEIIRDFKYTFYDNKIVITGTIDVLADFDIQKGFELLHNECKLLHQDKTWTDVSIEIITEL